MQPPKNKGTSKSASAKAKAPTLIDGLTKEEMSKEQLEEHIVRLREELDREREERNYFQLERDKIHTFWQITDRQLEEAKAERKNLDKDIEEDEGRHQVEIKVYKQKMKHLLCEHQNTISELTADGLVSSEVVQKEQEQLETKLHNEMKSIMVDMQELDNESLVKELELKHEEEMTKTKNHWEKQLKEIEAKYEKKIKLLPQELDNMRKNEISEREDHWNNHITALMENHNKALSEAHEMINYMQQDMEENDSLKVQEHTIDMNATLTEKALNDLKWDYEILEQKFSKLQLERDELYRSHAENIENLQHKAEVKSMLLERKLKTLTDSVEKTQAQLCAVLSASNMDQTALSGITDKIKENLDSSNISLKDLQCKKAQISKARKDLLLNYEAKQRALGVPVEELSAKPFEGTLAGQILQQDLGPK
uniref:Dynein regulatory complex subunit 4 n=1 Tax=Anabas testudineus TaxID=64144 RepID=A0A7N6BDP6_ANATE